METLVTIWYVSMCISTLYMNSIYASHTLMKAFERAVGIEGPILINASIFTCICPILNTVVSVAALTGYIKMLINKFTC